MVWKLIDTYPVMFMLTVVVPLIGGVAAALIGSWVGYENLKRQLSSSEQSQRIEQGVAKIATDATSLQSTLRLLETYNAKLSSAGKRDEVLVALIHQHQQLSRAADVFADMAHRDRSPDQGRIASEILRVLQTDLLQTHVRDDLPSKPLIINLTANSFRVIYAVPMRIPPKLTFTGLPEGVTPNVYDNSEISFTVSFYPLSIPVRTFGMIADARL